MFSLSQLYLRVPKELRGSLMKLFSRDGSTRYDAIRVIAESGHEQAVDVLIAALESTSRDSDTGVLIEQIFRLDEARAVELYSRVPEHRRVIDYVATYGRAPLAVESAPWKKLIDVLCSVIRRRQRSEIDGLINSDPAVRSQAAQFLAGQYAEDAGQVIDSVWDARKKLPSEALEALLDEIDRTNSNNEAHPASWKLVCRLLFSGDQREFLRPVVARRYVAWYADDPATILRSMVKYGDNIGQLVEELGRAAAGVCFDGIVDASREVIILPKLDSGDKRPYFEAVGAMLSAPCSSDEREMREEKCIGIFAPMLRVKSLEPGALCVLKGTRWPCTVDEARNALLHADAIREVHLDNKLLTALKILTEKGSKDDCDQIFGLLTPEKQESSSVNSPAEINEAAFNACLTLDPDNRMQWAIKALSINEEHLVQAAYEVLREYAPEDLSAEQLFRINWWRFQEHTAEAVFSLFLEKHPDQLKAPLELAWNSDRELVREAVIETRKERNAAEDLIWFKERLSDRALGGELKAEMLSVLAELGDAEWKELAVKLLNTDDWQARRAVVKLIGEHGSTEDLPLMERMFSDEDEHVRASAMDAHIALAPESRMRVLLRAAVDQEESLARGALEKLAETASISDYVEDLLILLKRKGGCGNVILRHIKIHGLKWLPRACELALQGRNVEAKVQVLNWVRQGKQTLPDEEALDRLLRDDDRHVRIRALQTIIKRCDSEFRKGSLLNALKDEDQEVCLTALEELENDADPELLEHILPLARDEGGYVRKAATRSISKFDDPRVYSELLSALNDVYEDVREVAEEIFKKGEAPVLARMEAEHGPNLKQRVETRVHEINRWASRIGQELLGRPVTVQQYRQGLGKTAPGDKHRPVEIEVSDTPVTSGHPYGEEVMKGLALHEIGHHIADIGQRGHRAMRGIARSEGIGEIYDLLLDERLERMMRSRRPEWGVYFDRLASYAFAQDISRIPLDAYAALLGMLPHKAEEALKDGTVPGRLADVNGQPIVLLRSADFLSIPGAIPPFVAFISCLRCGFSPEMCADANIPKAIAMVPANLKDLPHADVLKAARRIAKVIGTSDEHKQRMKQMQTMMREHRAAMKEMMRVLDKMGDMGQLPDWMQKGAAGIRKNREQPPEQSPPPERAPKLPSGQFLNLGKELEFDELEYEEKLPFHQAEHQALLARIRPHVRVLRRYFERLGYRNWDEYAQRRGHRIDLSQTKASLFRNSPNLLVHHDEEIAPDLYLGILIDRSGSMDGKKMELAKSFGMLAAESARGLRGIQGHINAFDDDTFYWLGSFMHHTTASLESGGGNNDAGGLHRAAELALRSGKKNKLLIMISDGSPTECTEDALKALVEKLERDAGIVCTQVAVDEMDAECFRYFVDLGRYSFEEAVSRFGRLLMQLTAQWRR